MRDVVVLFRRSQRAGAQRHRTDFSIECGEALGAAAARAVAAAGGEVDDAEAAGADDDADAAVDDAQARLAVRLQRDVVGHAASKGRRRDELFLVVVGGDAVAKARHADLDGTLVDAVLQQLAGRRERQRAGLLPAAGIANDDAGFAVAGGDRQVADLERTVADVLREGAHVVDVDIDRRRHGCGAGEARQCAGDEIRPELIVVLDLCAAKAERPRPGEAAGDAVADAIGLERFGIDADRVAVEAQGLRITGDVGADQEAAVQHAVRRDQARIEADVGAGERGRVPLAEVACALFAGGKQAVVDDRAVVGSAGNGLCRPIVGIVDPAQPLPIRCGDQDRLRGFVDLVGDALDVLETHQVARLSRTRRAQEQLIHFAARREQAFARHVLERRDEVGLLAVDRDFELQITRRSLGCSHRGGEQHQEDNDEEPECREFTELALPEH